MAVLLYNELTYEIYKWHVSPRKEAVNGILWYDTALFLTDSKT